jgi:hypothetical protein
VGKASVSTFSIRQCPNISNWTGEGVGRIVLCNYCVEAMTSKVEGSVNLCIRYTVIRAAES